MVSASQKLEGTFAVTGLTAIVAGGGISAFLSNQPSTLAMWVSAYLVLVVGVAQIFFSIAIPSLVVIKTKKALLWVFWLFNTGNALVVLSSVLKYSSYELNSLAITIIGALLILASLGLLAKKTLKARPSQLRTATHLMIVILASTVVAGLFLAAN